MLDEDEAEFVAEDAVFAYGEAGVGFLDVAEFAGDVDYGDVGAEEAEPSSKAPPLKASSPSIGEPWGGMGAGVRNLAQGLRGFDCGLGLGMRWICGMTGQPRSTHASARHDQVERVRWVTQVCEAECLFSALSGQA